METNPTTTNTVVTFSQNVYHDWQSRGFISSLQDDYYVQVIKENKRFVTLEFDPQLLAGFIYDLQLQIQIIVQNNDGDYGTKRMYQTALAKFKLAAANGIEVK